MTILAQWIYPAGGWLYTVLWVISKTSFPCCKPLIQGNYARLFAESMKEEEHQAIKIGILGTLYHRYTSITDNSAITLSCFSCAVTIKDTNRWLSIDTIRGISKQPGRSPFQGYAQVVMVFEQCDSCILGHVTIWIAKDWLGRKFQCRSRYGWHR